MFGGVLGVDLPWLIVAGSASILLYWAIRAARWQLLIRSLKMRIGFADLCMCNAVSLSFSLITPLGSGEAVKVELLKKYGMVGRYEGCTRFSSKGRLVRGGGRLADLPAEHRHSHGIRQGDSADAAAQADVGNQQYVRSGEGARRMIGE